MADPDEAHKAYFELYLTIQLYAGIQNGGIKEAVCVVLNNEILGYIFEKVLGYIFEKV